MPNPHSGAFRKGTHLSCFGKLDVVFPTGKNGFRNTPETCLACFCKTECLRSAMNRPEGLKVRESAVDRAYEAGMMKFLERWSTKKNIHRKIKAEQKYCKS